MSIRWRVTTWGPDSPTVLGPAMTARGGFVWGDVSDPTAQRPALVLADAIRRGVPGVEDVIAGLLLDDSPNVAMSAVFLLEEFERRHRRPAFIDLAALRREPV